MTPSECLHFISAADSIEGGLVDFAANAGEKAKKYRNMSRIVTQSDCVSKIIFDRILPHLKNGGDFTVAPDTDSVYHVGVHCMIKCEINGGQFLFQDMLGASIGRWTAYGISERWRLCRYDPGGHFAPHFDSDTWNSTTDKSLQTVQVYLNGDFDGGGINFVRAGKEQYVDGEGRMRARGDNVILSVKPEAGMVVVFDHKVLHEGEACEGGRKYFMRSELMFGMAQKAAESSAVSEDDLRAVELVKRAETLEAAGDNSGAAECWRKAFKLSTSVEKHFNEGNALRHDKA